MNPLKIMQIKSTWDRFSKNHPKFSLFLKNISESNTIKKDTIIEINVSTADGKQYTSNLKISDEDLQLFEDLKEITKH